MRIEMDKMAHLGWGAMICACVTFLLGIQDGAQGWEWLAWSIAGWVAAMTLECVKEWCIDDSPDLADIAWTAAGAAVVTLAMAVGSLLHTAVQ